VSLENQVIAAKEESHESHQVDDFLSNRRSAARNKCIIAKHFQQIALSPYRADDNQRKTSAISVYHHVGNNNRGHDTTV
jgi:hypothetical protein